MKNKGVFKIAFTAVMISMSIAFEILSKFIPFFSMFFPYGGSISLSMLPLAVVAVVCGFYYALASGIIYGVLNCFVIDGAFYNLVSFILDYLVAFSGVAVIGLFRKQILESKKRYFVLGFILALVIRLLASGFSGVINASVFGLTPEFLESIFGKGNSGMFWLYFYSFICYNLPYIAISGILCIVIGLSIYKVIFLNDTIVCK